MILFCLIKFCKVIRHSSFRNPHTHRHKYTHLNVNRLVSSIGVTMQHPLEVSEKTYTQRKEKLEMALLCKTTGIQGPLKLMAERRCLKKVGHLHFLPRHEVALNALTGRDELIGPNDYLGHVHESEYLVQPIPNTAAARTQGFH